MKTLTLLQAFAILQDAAAVIIDGTVIYPSLDEIQDDDSNEFMFLEWEIDGLTYSAKFCEGENQIVKAAGGSLFLIDHEGDETQIQILEFADVTGENQKLIEFAKRTLATLQNTEEWSSDTTDEIDTHAANLGLRILDGESRFVATVYLSK